LGSGDSLYPWNSLRRLHMDPLLWVLVAAVGVAALYFIFVRKMLNRRAASETKAQPPAAP
jgi:hypothetical protein